MLKHLLKIIMKSIEKKEDRKLFFAKDEFIFLLTFIYTSGINSIVLIILNIINTFQIIFYLF